MATRPRLPPLAKMSDPRLFGVAARGMALAVAAGASLAVGTAAEAADPDVCAAPAGIGLHSCVFPEGQVVVETTLVDWEHDTGGPLTTTSVLGANTLVHVGLTHRLEVQIGWAPFDRERILDHRNDFAAQDTGLGDVVVGGKAELLADDAIVGLALQGNLSIPVGNLRFGGKSPGGTVALAIAYDITDRVSVALTPQADYLPDRVDGGRHLLFGATAGVDVVVAAEWTATGEYRLARDLDPAFHRTEHIVGLAVAFTPSKRWQVNGGLQLGVTPNSPRAEVTFGIAHHFR